MKSYDYDDEPLTQSDLVKAWFRSLLPKRYTTFELNRAAEIDRMVDFVIGPDGMFNIPIGHVGRYQGTPINPNYPITELKAHTTFVCTPGTPDWVIFTVAQEKVGGYRIEQEAIGVKEALDRMIERFMVVWCKHRLENHGKRVIHIGDGKYKEEDA